MILPLALLLSHQQNMPQVPKGGPSVIRVPTLKPAPKSFLKAPKGFKVSLYADNLRNPRMMAAAPNGDVFVVETRIEKAIKNMPHQVHVLGKMGSDGKAKDLGVWSDQLNYPFGIRFAFGCLYVANTGSIVRWNYKLGQTRPKEKAETVLSGIPDLGYRNHWTRNILFSHDFKHLFLTIGSEKNLAEEGPRRAAIERYNLDEGGQIIGKGTLFANGLRNPIGLATNPRNNELWTAVNERDYQGDDLVPDFATSVKEGGFYGWPYYYIGGHRDTRMPNKPALKDKVLVPSVLFTAHTAPIDLTFASSTMFPPEYNGDLYVTQHGSQNRSKMVGYKIVRIRMDAKGKPTGKVEDFVTGWLPPGSNKEIYGRPAGLCFLPDGSMLVADDWAGKIWRISHT